MINDTITEEIKPIYINGGGPSKISGYAFVVGIISLFFSFLFYLHDSHHFFFSYLTAFTFFLTLSLGSLFFVMLLYLTRAGWGIVIRRIAEHMMKNIWLMALFFVPIFFGLEDLYHWTAKHAMETDPLLQHKSGFLNVSFFLFRAGFFFFIWIWLSSLFFRKSTFQDQFNNIGITIQLQKIAAIGIVLYALTQSFGFVDWVMSITPHWFSTIFGVYFFAGSVIVSLSTITIIALYLRKHGYLNHIITVEHYHDLGKLIYGFNIFWTYIAFSQFFLIWYADIPEETVWYLQHFEGSWGMVAKFLVIGHFFVPFLLLMPKYVKRNLRLLTIMVIWMIFMHFVDMYWIIMPNASPEGFHLSLVDVFCFLGIGGIFVGLLFSRMKKFSLFPHNDPRIQESLSLKQL